MAVRPKKAISYRGEGGVGGVRGASSSTGKASKAKAQRQKNIDAFSTNYVANQSVKVLRGATNPSEAKRLNELANARAKDIASGARAKRESANVKQSKPAKVVKINSAPAKSPDAARAANAKALKAANKKKK